MAFDGLFTKAMVSELQPLVSGRITKIHQPNQTEIVVQIRAAGSNHKVLFSIHPSYARIHITSEAIDNPPEPPMFCMLMRKHLEGGFISSITQHEMDRLIVFTIESSDEIGDKVTRELHIEIMGRHSNILLVDPKRNVLLDSLKHVSPSENRHRSLMPGATYVAPPSQHKLAPQDATKSDIESLLASEDSVNSVVATIAGFSKLHAEELVYQLRKSMNKYDTYQQFIASFDHKNPEGYYYQVGAKSIFSSIELSHLQVEPTKFATLGQLLDKIFFAKAERDRVKQQAGDLEKWLTNELAKLRLKSKKLQKERQSAEKLDTYKQKGELLTANIYQLEKGMTEATLLNYYEDDSPEVTIALDPRKTPVENAQAFYSKYNKAKTALIKTEEQLRKTSQDLEYLELIQQQLMHASTEDIREIREELAEEGWLKHRKSKQKKKASLPLPEKFVSTTGTPISVGKNNKQNDYVTFKLAKKSDLWLHTKDIPGSHVVIHHDNPDEETIIEAATLAAYFSKARESSSVPVDYTVIRQVKKPNGSKPGFVIYFEQKTVFVTPDEDVVRKLRKK
ncbi:Rqc2 family fibronectin-binding protein [Paenisporosarcina cavernae]|uniref:Rqc2 homolog RqcH n=1 Tax=Paenisporosarcina cavernae TaxID=2320858 RepID=A0A385YR41_9BACL|nr:NFACT RNA binding domain-containing protein [Paenisporosarcina cavernae]AYC29189.1 fibronectin/fibrinogen-binding protein [Paenisporosarcina cavernae]